MLPLSPCRHWRVPCPLDEAKASSLPPMQALVKAMPPSMWTEEEQGRTNALIGGRKENIEKYKPCVKAMYLVGVEAGAGIAGRGGQAL